MGAEKECLVAGHVERGRWHGETKTGANDQPVRPEEMKPIRSEAVDGAEEEEDEDDVDEEMIPVVEESAERGVLLTMEDVFGRDSDDEVLGKVVHLGEGHSNGLGHDVVAVEEQEHEGGPADAHEVAEGPGPRGMKGPQKFNRQEREEHELTHIPYRSWCDVCVRARGRKGPHFRKDKAADSAVEDVPGISQDYYFMNDRDRQEGSIPILIKLDESTGEKYSRAVGRKGVGHDGEMDWFVKDICEELRAWGHPGGAGNRIILKSDGRRAIQSLKNRNRAMPWRCRHS